MEALKEGLTCPINTVNSVSNRTHGMQSLSKKCLLPQQS